MSQFEKDKLIQSLYRLDGVIPSPEDKRDYTPATVAMATPTTPEEYRLPHNALVLNQGVYGSCVAHSLATAMYYGEAVAGVKKNNFSRGFIYGNRLDSQHQGEGMVPREALYQLNHDGDCLYKDFPYNNTYPWCRAKIKKNELELKKKARPYTIANYFALTTREEIKQALMTCGAVICCVPVYSGFSGNTPLPEPKEMCSGYHALCLVGWDKEGWILQNSWGYEWGNKGFLHIPFAYPVQEWWGINVTREAPLNVFIRKVSEFLKSIFSK